MFARIDAGWEAVFSSLLVMFLDRHYEESEGRRGNPFSFTVKVEFARIAHRVCQLTVVFFCEN
ncbi:hypothetical protein GCM10009123_04290 [Kangiella japonica]|uniref:Uncharacterized protein n=1 Tax=Kangiella japonica TaxID=647384 RepID=A0ABP3CE60_9GAMM